MRYRNFFVYISSTIYHFIYVIYVIRQHSQLFRNIMNFITYYKIIVKSNDEVPISLLQILSNHKNYLMSGFIGVIKKNFFESISCLFLYFLNQFKNDHDQIQSLLLFLNTILMIFNKHHESCHKGLCFSARLNPIFLDMMNPKN